MKTYLTRRHSLCTLIEIQLVNEMIQNDAWAFFYMLCLWIMIISLAKAGLGDTGCVALDVVTFWASAHLYICMWSSLFWRTSMDTARACRRQARWDRWSCRWDEWASRGSPSSYTHQHPLGGVMSWPWYTVEVWEQSAGGTDTTDKWHHTGLKIR